MQFTLDEIRLLREKLDSHRIEHEALIAQARILREHCQEVRQLYQRTNERIDTIYQSKAAILKSPELSTF